jgi:hypothetical protein
VFYLSAGIYFGLNTIFLVFSSSTVQPWNTYWESQTEKDKKDKKEENKKY